MPPRSRSGWYPAGSAWVPTAFTPAGMSALGREASPHATVLQYDWYPAGRASVPPSLTRASNLFGTLQELCVW